MAAEGLDPTLQKMLKAIQDFHGMVDVGICWEFFLKSSERTLNMTSHFFVANGVLLMAKGLSLMPGAGCSNPWLEAAFRRAC